LLVVSSRHVRSFAELPSVSRRDAQALVEGLAGHIHANFGQPAYIFEHGVPVGGGGACGVDHAHVHVLPLPPDIASAVQARVDKDFPAAAHGALSEVLDLMSAQKHESYLIYGSSSAELGVCAGRQIRSQYMREVIAGQTGSQRYDWKGLYNADAFALSYKAGAEYGHA
jgi:diadenosine tetraphosphate (Ap4A) HIT family hydrolase